MIAGRVLQRIATRGVAGGKWPGAATATNARFFSAETATFDVDGSFEVSQSLVIDAPRGNTATRIELYH